MAMNFHVFGFSLMWFNVTKMWAPDDSPTTPICCWCFSDSTCYTGARLAASWYFTDRSHRHLLTCLECRYKIRLSRSTKVKKATSRIMAWNEKKRTELEKLVLLRSNRLNLQGPEMGARSPGAANVSGRATISCWWRCRYRILISEHWFRAQN